MATNTPIDTASTWVAFWELVYAEAAKLRAGDVKD